MTTMEWLLDDGLTSARTFREHFKCTKDTFRYIVSELAPYLAPADRAFRPDLVQPAEAVGMALHYMTHKGEGNDTANLFARGASTIFRWLDKFCAAVVHHWGETLIDLPSVDELLTLCTRLLEERGMPGCWGGMCSSARVGGSLGVGVVTISSGVNHSHSSHQLFVVSTPLCCGFW